jgi:hypothetical protein
MPTSPLPLAAANLEGSVIIVIDSLHAPKNDGAAAITDIDTAYGMLRRFFHSSSAKFSLIPIYLSPISSQFQEISVIYIYWLWAFGENEGGTARGNRINWDSHVSAHEEKHFSGSFEKADVRH